MIDRRLSCRLQGVGLSEGVSMGTAYRIEPRTTPFYRIRIDAQQVDSELARLHEAIAKSRAELQEVKRKFEAEVGKEHAYIIDAHLLMLEDEQFLQEIEDRIHSGFESPERAVREAADRWVSVYRSLDDPYFQERGSDIEEVVERLIAHLMQLDAGTSTELPEDVILVAPEVSLFLLSEYPLNRVKGLVMKRGGQTSHVVIVARSCRIPVISGVEDVEHLIHTGDPLILDGEAGLVLVRPSREDIDGWRQRADLQQQPRRQLVCDDSPCQTRDGCRIVLYANAEFGSEVKEDLQLGGEGIGLFRTEYIYMRERSGPISEEEQFKIYRQLAAAVGKKPAIVRTLDLGDEGHPYFSRLTGASGPVMGLRGIRLSLKYPEIYRSQVRAILKASQHGNLKIVLPMVSSVEEVIEARHLIDQASEELSREGLKNPGRIEVGVMIELPAAVLLLEGLVPHADFFAVGSNDLIQYTLAAGRNDDGVAHLFNPLHPAILRSLKQIAEVSGRTHRMAIICGEIASQPLYAYLLVGMGFRHLSMNPLAIAGIKHVIRGTSAGEARQTVDQLLRLSTRSEIEQHLREQLADAEPAIDRAIR